MLRWLHTFVALVLLPAMLLAGGDARAAARFRCADTELVRSSCCCPGSLHATKTDLTVTQGCCCKLERPAHGPVPGSAPALERWAAVDAAVYSEQTRPDNVWPPQPARRPITPAAPHEPRSRAGPSLIIAQRRLLI